MDREQATPREVEARLRAVVAGEQGAAAWLYDTFAPRLYRRLLRRYGYPGGLEVDDLLHDAFVLYFRNQGRLLAAFLDRLPAEQLSEPALERYLWDQACGLASNRRRSAALRKVVSIEEIREPVDPGDDEQSLLSKDTLQRIVSCLRQRGERIFLYLSFRYADGLTPEQISQATGWSRKATYKLKQALNRAVKECSEKIGLSVS